MVLSRSFVRLEHDIRFYGLKNIAPQNRNIMLENPRKYLLNISTTLVKEFDLMNSLHASAKYHEYNERLETVSTPALKRRLEYSDAARHVGDRKYSD